jgi:hypothetical protein
MASLYKRGRTYYASFSDPERGRKRVSLRTSDKASARALLARFERLVALGGADPWTDDHNGPPLILNEPAEPFNPRSRAVSRRSESVSMTAFLV